MVDADEADRLWLQASQLRLIADGLEARAAERRYTRTPYNHLRTYWLLWERDWGEDSRALSEAYGYSQTGPLCDYCDRLLHPYDPTHVESVEESGGEEEERCANIEHLTPVARGGTNELDNLTLSCRPCNRRKGTLTEAEFRLVLAVDGLTAQPPPDGWPEPEGLSSVAMGDLLAVVEKAVPPGLWQRVIAWWGERSRVISEQNYALIAAIINECHEPRAAVDFDDSEPF